MSDQDQRSACFMGEAICGNCKHFKVNPNSASKMYGNCNLLIEPSTDRFEGDYCIFMPTRFVPTHGSSLGETKVKDFKPDSKED